MLGVAALVLVVMWLPPVIDQLAHSPGNLTATSDYFSGAKQPPQGVRNAARVVGAQFTLGADWLFGLRGVSPFSGEPAAMHQDPVPVLLLAFVVAGVVAVRRKYASLRGFVVIMGITIVVGTFAVAQIIGAMSEYRLRWLWVVAALATALTLAVAVRRLAERSSRAGAGAIVGITVAAVVMAGFGVRAAPPPIPPPPTTTLRSAGSPAGWSATSRRAPRRCSCVPRRSPRSRT